MALCAICLFGCDDLLGGGDPIDPVIPDYNRDVETVAPENIEAEHFVKEEDKTYVARFELVNPDTATYGCIYYDGKDFIELEPREGEPYIFIQRLSAEAIDSLPNFYSLSYKEYKLDAESEHLSKTGKSYYFKKQVLMI